MGLRLLQRKGFMGTVLSFSSFFLNIATKSKLEKSLVNMYQELSCQF